MKRLNIWALLACMGLLVSTNMAQGDEAKSPVAAKTRVVCFGDSITAGKYPDHLAELRPDLEIVNAGVGGNTTGQGLARIEADVLSRKPNVVLIMFGTNDSVLRAAKAYRTPLKTFGDNVEKMILACRAAGAEPVVATLLPIISAPYYTRHPKEFYTPEGGLDAILARYRGATVEVAERHMITVVDMNTLIAGDETHLKPDGVHPNEAGEKAIAQHFADALVVLEGKSGE